MKLHLPKGLKAALLATFTVLAASWSHQGYAAELNKVITMSEMAQEATITDGATLSTTWEMTDGVVYDFSGSGYLGGIANTDLLNALKGDDYVTVAAWINPSSHAAGTGGGDGGSLFGYGAQGDGIKVIDRNGALKATTKNVADFTTSAVGIDLNTWQLVAVTMHRNNGKLDVYYMLDGVYSSVVTGGAPNPASTDSFAIGSGNSESRRELYLGSIGNMIVFTSTEMVTVTDVTSQMGTAPTKIGAVELTWNGTAPTAAWDYTSTNWLKAGSPSTFETGAGVTVIFGTGTVAKTVTINETIDAGDVVVSDNYTFTMGTDATLMMNSLSLDAGKTLALGGTGTVMAGGLTYGSGSALNITGNIAMRGTALTSGTTASLHVLNGGVLTIGTDATVDGQGFGNTGEVPSAAFSKVFQGSAVAVEKGGKLVLEGNINTVEQRDPEATLTSGVDSLEIQGSLQVNTWGPTTYKLGDHSMKVTGDAWFTNRQFVEVAGGNFEVEGTLALAHAQNNAAGRYRASVTATENSTLTLRDIVFYGGRNEVNVDGSTLTFTQESGLLTQAGDDTPTAEADLNTMNFNNATLVAQANSWELAPLDSATVNTSGTATLDVAEGQGMTLTFTTVDGSFTKDGAGTATVSGTGYLNDTIVVKQGELVLGGTYGIDNNMGGMDVSYSGAEHAQNGFRTTKGSIIVYTTQGTAVFSGDAEFTYEGAAVTLTEGKYQAPEKTDNTTFYVNTDAESVSKATARPEMQHIVLAGNTTLNVDQDVAGSVVSVASGTATVNILADKTVNGTMLGVTLTGAGTYALTEGTAELGTGVLFGEGWTGAVRISNTTKEDQTGAWISNLAKDGSWVEFIHFKGYDRAWTSTFSPEVSANIKLTSDGANAAWELSAYASSTYTMVATGDWQGDGTFLMAGGSASQSQAVEYKGDITNWTGSIEVNSPGMRRVAFSENATAVNVALVNSGSGAFELVVNNAATFSKEVNVTKLTVDTAKSATFQANTTVGQLAGSGSIVKTGADTTMTVTASTGTGTSAAMLDITVSEGTLKATAANALGSGDITVADGATLDLVNGGALAGTQTVDNGGNVLLHSTLTQGTVNGGVLTLASDFPVDGDILDVEDSDTGNGFSQGGTAQVYDTANATLSDDIDIVHGETHYALTDLTDGAITLSGADWNTYQLNVDAQYAVQAIMDYAKENGGELKTISVNDDMLRIDNDSTTLKTSMLGGEHLATFAVYMSGTSGLTIDGNCGAAISTNTGAEGTITLETDATVGSIVAGDFENSGAGNLTINGEGRTVKADGAGAAFGGVLALGKGVTLELLHDTSFTTVMNATVKLGESASLVLNEVSFSTVEGGTGATIEVISDEYIPMYAPNIAEYNITGTRIVYNTTAAFDLGHVIDATSQVVNEGTGSLRDISSNEEYAELNAKGGDIYISTPLESGIETRALIVGDLTLANGRTVAEDTGKAVSITVNGTAGFGSGATVGAALTMAGGSTLDAANPVALANHSLALGTTAGDKLAIGADLWSTLSGLSALESANLFTGVSALTLAGTEYTEDVDLSTIFTHDSLKAKKYMLGYDAAGKNVTITRLADNNRYWTGGTGTWDYTSTTVWTDEDGAPAAFSSGYNAYFTAATNGTVTLGENVTAESITVSGADYTFAPNGHTLTVNKSVEADVHKATFNMTLSGTDLKLIAKNGGAITLANGGSVKDVEVGTGSTVSATASLTVTGGFTNAGQVNADTLTLTQGTTAGGNANVQTLNLTSGQSYTFGNLTANSVNGTGANLTIGTGNTLTVSYGEATVAALTLGDNATVTGSGTVTANGVTLQGGAAVSGKLSTGALSGTGTLTLLGGSLTFTAATTLTDTDLAFSGDASITSQSGTLTFKGTLSNIKGAMTFVGSFDVGNCDTVDGTATYVEGGITGNGFKQAQKVVSIINGGSADGTNATLTYNGKSIGKMGTDGKVQFQGDTEYDKYYVNSGTEKATTALDNEKQQLGTFELAAGTTLVVDKNISMGMVNAAGAATLQIDSGKTVTTDGTAKALTLTGAGTLAVDAGKTATGVTLGDAWTGTVSFTEARLTTIADAWGNANSTVALQDTYGSLGTAEVDYDLELRKGTGSNWGFGATATGDSMLTLNGDVKGAGDLGVKAGTGSSTFILKGSTGDWTGNFVDNSAADASTSLILDSAEKTIRGMVGAVSPGGELSYASNLEVTTVANTTFEKAVQVAGLISMGGTTKLQENSTVGTLSNTANLELAANKTLTIREQLSYGTGSGIFKMGAHSQVALAENATMGYLGDYDACYKGGTVTNGTNEQQTFGLDNKNITVDGATIMLSGSAVTVNNVLTNAKADTLAVEQGNVSLNNVAGPLTVGTSLSIGANKTFKVANTDGAAKQTVVMGANSTLTTGIGSKLDADLTLSGNVTTDMAAELAMNGGALTLNKGLTLAGGLYDAVDALSEAGAYVNLFTGVGALTLGTDTYTEPVKALPYFTNLSAFSDRGDYFLKYDSGIVSIYFTPTDARTLTWNGTEGNSTWEVGEGTAENWLDTTLADTHFASGDNARFTGDAEKKLVTIAEDITARNITVTDSRYTIENDADRTITADQFAVNNAALGKKGDGKLVLAVDTPVSLENGAFAVQAGDVEIGAADSAGTLEMAGSMLDIAPGSTLTVATITADEDSTIELDGTLQVAKGSVMYIEASEGSLLKIADVGTATAGTLAVNTDAYLYGLENHGTLDLGTHELTLMEKTAQGGNVTAGKITLAETGSTFGDLKANTIQYGLKSADDATLDAENPNLVVDSIAAGGVFPVVTLDISETMHGEGSLAPIQRTGEEVTYTLLHANDGLGSTSFTLNTGALDLLKQNGLLHADAGLVKTDNDVTLTIGGLDLTWYTDKDVTEWGYTVVSNDSITHGGNTLNGVEHVVVDASRTIDVTGAGSEPGLRVRNITGLDGRTITFTGTQTDTVNLVTNEETASNVNLAAEGITLKVGLDELDDMDPVDYKDLRVGDVTLSGATLDVHAHEGLDDSFTVNSLNGDSDSMLKGTLIVEGRDGDYSGEYEDATVILHANADQMLAADEGLTVMGLGLARITYSGTQTHMDGIEGIGLRVMLNDTTTDNSRRTLTLDNEYSYISNGAVGIGLSAVASAATLDTDEAPDLLKAKHLDMSGSTLYIFQAAVDGDTLVMNVNDGGYKRGLLLAHFGAEDTTAEDVQLQGNLFNKYYQNARLEGGKVLVDRNRSFYTDITAPTSENGKAGAGMLDDALLYNNPQVANPTGDLAAVMTALEQGRYTQSGADKVMAAMSGASQAAMGAAWNRDVDRQLRAIRNRTTQMGLAECTHHEGLPYFNAWINAEGDYSKLDADGTLAGYKLTSWGGTLGVDVDCTNRFTMGVAVTAMSGDFTASSVERAEGDLDRLYVSVFGRYTHRAWTHTFVATYGMADTKLKRTVDYTYGSYNTDSSSDGKAFGLMYEVGYVTALNEDSSTCLQPVLNLSYRHSSLAGCSEQSSSDTALRLGNAEANVFTAAIGARLQSAVGTSVYNRASIFEGRVMLKFDTGDRDVSARNGFAGVPGGRDAKSTEAGMFGVEVGAGLTIPLSENAGALFFDVTGDFRAKDTEVNGTVGYRYNF